MQRNFHLPLLWVLFLMPLISHSQHWDEHVILSGQGALNTLTRVGSGDLDQDGDDEILISAGTMYYFDNLGNGEFSDRILINDGWAPNWGTNLHLHDADNDGDLDILAILNLREIHWLINDGVNGFHTVRVGAFTYEINCVELQDMDGDGDMDVISSSNQTGLPNFEQLRWFENRGNLEYANYTVANNVGFRRFVFAEDVNSDDSPDIITLDINQDLLAWYQNDGQGNFAEVDTLLSPLPGDIVSAEMSDLDGDGLADLIFSTKGTSQRFTRWSRNSGAGSFEDLKTISSTSTPGSFGSSYITTADLDQDGDIDIIETETNPGIVRRLENLGNSQFRFQDYVFSNNDRNPYYPATGDFNGDGFTDVACYYDTDPTVAYFDHIAWFELDRTPAISAELVEISCVDPNTPLDTLDDLIEARVDLRTYLLSGRYKAEASTGSVSPNEGEVGDFERETFRFDPGTAGSGDLILTFFDPDEPQYRTELTISDPGKCSEVPLIKTPRLIRYCEDNQTPADTTDDIVVFELLATAENHTGTYQLTNDLFEIEPSTGKFGDTVTFRLPPGSSDWENFSYNIQISDAQYPSILNGDLPIINTGYCNTEPDTAIIRPDDDYYFRFGEGDISMSKQWAAINAENANVFSPGGKGGVFLFQKVGSSWQQKQLLTSPNELWLGAFGNALSISEDRLVVGAFQEQGGGSRQGTAYVYRLNGDQWELETQLLASDGGPNDEFGWTVALLGNRIAIGARRDYPLDSKGGKVYLFELRNGQWEEVQILEHPESRSQDQYSQSLAIAKDYLFVGAPNQTNPDNSLGNISVYQLDSISGQYQAVSTLMPQSHHPDGIYGRFLDATEEHLLVSNAIDFEAWRWSEDTWVRQQKIEIPETDFYDDGKVRLHGQQAILANFYPINFVGAPQAYRYQFDHETEQWELEEEYLPINGPLRQLFAQSFDLNEDGVMIAAPFNEVMADYQGMVFYYGLYPIKIPTVLSTNPSTKDYFLSPNPAQDRLHLAIPEADLQKVEIHDALGRRFPVSRQGQDIDISALAPGLYWLVVQLTSQQRWVQAWVKME